MRGTILTNLGTKYEYKDPKPNPKKQFVDPNPKKISSDPQHWFGD
jgi:hypothetical protein